MSGWFTRVRLFVRDYISEFGVAWSVAKHRDCERNGGHRWGQPKVDSLGLNRECARCGTCEIVTQTSGTTATNTPFTIT